MSSPAQRSLDEIRKKGYTAQVTEHWNAFARVRQDLFNFIDIVAIKSGEPGVLGIQTTTKKNMSARVLKIKQEPKAKVWLASGNSIVVDGWEKNRKTGRWELWQEEITADNIYRA